jgi:hypothetical protein
MSAPDYVFRTPFADKTGEGMNCGKSLVASGYRTGSMLL